MKRKHHTVGDGDGKKQRKKRTTQKNARYQANLDMEIRQSGIVKQG